MRTGVLLLLLMAGCVRADWQTRSWSQWRIDPEGVEALIGIERAELVRLRGSADSAWFAEEIRAAVRVRDGDRDCTLLAVAPAPAAEGVTVLRARFRCGDPLAAPRVAVRLFFALDAGPLHHASFVYADGRRDEVLFTRAEPERALAPAPRPEGIGATLARYAGLGFHHILAGLDHVAFLLCMLLAASRLSSRLWMITGFTLGHSVTLSLSVLGLIAVRSAAVEALIGYTVALLAAEACARRGARHAGSILLSVIVLVALWSGRSGGALAPLTLGALLVLTPAYLALARRRAATDALHLGMTAVFGLVHGCGFAGVLLALGVPAERRGWALAGFNIGVELGQLLLLAAFATLLAALRRLPGTRGENGGARWLAVALCAVGVYWFAGRSLA